MTVALIITLGMIGSAGALLSGMLGIGGAIVNYPLLLYVPAWLGLARYTPHEVSGIVALQVFFSTLSGVVALRKERLLHRRLVLDMGAAVLIGSFAGSYGARFLPGSAVNTVYAVLATAAAVMMLIPSHAADLGEVIAADIPFSRWLAVVSAVVIGCVAGIVGAGGAFLLVPVMLQVLRIPTRVTIASSMAITLVSSVGSVAGKVLAGHIPYGPAAVVAVASVLVAPLGVLAGRRVNPKVLRILLAGLIIATAIKIWTDLLH